MIRLFYILTIIFIGHGIFNVSSDKMNFYNWYEAFILIILDKFIIAEIPSYSRLLILLYFIFLTILSIRKLNLLKIDYGLVE
nr:hypothetical protein [Helcococcus sueciensis]